MKAQYYFRIILAFVCSFLIVIHGHWFEILRAISSFTFWLAVAFSFCVAYALIYYIWKVTVILDRKYNWQERFWERLTFQLGLGVLIPALLDLGLVIAYLHAMGKPENLNLFFLADYLPIILFIILLNASFVIWRLLWKTIEESKYSNLFIDYNGLHVHFNVQDEIMYFFRIGKKVKALTIHGNIYPATMSILALEERYSEVGFCKINRAMILNKKIVRGYVPGPKRDTLKVLIKPQYLEHIKNTESDFFQVTGKHIESFRSAIEEK